MQEGAQITRNTAYLTGAFIGQKILSFIFFTLIARLAGVEDTGKYFFALSFTTVFSIFVDLGLSSVLVREVAKFKGKTIEYLNNILGVKLILSFLASAAVIIFINLLGYSEITRQLVYIACVIMLLDSFHLSFYGIFRAHQNLKYEALGVIIGQTLTLIIGGSALAFHWPIHWLIIAVLSNSLFNFIYSLLLLVKKFQFWPTLSYNKEIIKFLFKIAIPFALAGIFVKINSVDSVLISKMLSETHVGWYSVPYKITFALQFIPMAFAASIFPAMSSCYVSAKEKLSGIFEKSMFYLMIISIPTAIGTAVLAPELIKTVYGNNYLTSIPLLQILIFSIIPIFLTYPVGSLMNACDKQTTHTTNMGIASLINIILNIILIPRLGLLGAVISALSGHSLFLVLDLFWVFRIVPGTGLNLLKFALKTTISGVFMGFMVFYTKTYINWILGVPAGIISFFGFLMLVRGLTKEDVTKIFRTLFKKEDST
ncbi:MAG: flippase [Patescibacteria group bacterium]|nr:flippase [Patescibacteria group bacterium]MDD5490492.1 flippase [Patescibacteria group bacterium]